MAEMIEVELKARVADLASLEERASGLARPGGDMDHRDTYFCPKETEGYTFNRFRLRESSGRSTVTFKRRLPGHQCEASRELEFEVGDAGAFREFVLAFGFKVMLTKKKTGKRFIFESGEGPPLSIELVMVEGLGGFVEIEALLETPDRIAPAEKRIRNLLAELGVPESALEPRPYTLLLYGLEAAEEGRARP